MKTSSKLLMIGALTVIFIVLVLIPPMEVKAESEGEWVFIMPGYAQKRFFGVGFICHCPRSDASCGCAFNSPPEAD